MFKIDCQKHFTKLQKMKNTQSAIKPIKIGKRLRTTYCFGCKGFTHNFKPQEVKMTNKVLREKSNCVVCWSNKSRFLKQNAPRKNNSTLCWSYKSKMKIYCMKCRKDTEDIDPKMAGTKNHSLCTQNSLFVKLKSKDLWKSKKQIVYWVI